MKKFKLLAIAGLLFLVGCIRPPVPDVEAALQDANPDGIIPLSNALTDGYFRTALPVRTSPTRGLIYQQLSNRADIEQVERSMLRIATDFFDPEVYFFQDGQFLSRDFAISVLRPHNPDDEQSRGLNPPIGSTHEIGGREVESATGALVLPFAYVLEQNFGHIDVQANAFVLEGATIVLALNPYYRFIDRSIGVDQLLRRPDEEVLTIGRETAEALVPLIRTQQGLEEVQLIVGLFILQAGNEVIPGRMAEISVVDAGAETLGSWQDINERHFHLAPLDARINEVDVNFIDEFTFFRDTISLQFPYNNGIVGRVHAVNDQIARVDITFNMQFLGFSEKVAFHQVVGQYVTEFSHHYDINIIVRDTRDIHGIITRPAFGQVFVHPISW